MQTTSGGICAPILKVTAEHTVADEADVVHIAKLFLRIMVVSAVRVHCGRSNK